MGWTLVLSGGAVRGFIHVGFLEALEAAGLRPSRVVGTSAGALAGALYCAGVPPAEIAALAGRIGWLTLGRLTRPGIAFLDNARMGEFLERWIGPGRTFESLEIPLRVVAVDLLRGERVVLGEGPVAPAVRASTAIPGIFTPVPWRDTLLVDGGILENFPVPTARAWSPDPTVGVNLLPQAAPLPRPQTAWEVALVALYWMTARGQAQEADLTFWPPARTFRSWTRIREARDLVELGRRMGEEAAPQIEAFLEGRPGRLRRWWRRVRGR